MKHTPGPWFIIKPKNVVTLTKYQNEDRLIYAGGHRHIAETFQYQNEEHHDSNGESISNAKLIAAAPDLLETCQYILHVLKGRPCREVTLEERLEKTIAKAEGKEE